MARSFSVVLQSDPGSGGGAGAQARQAKGGTRRVGAAASPGEVIARALAETRADVSSPSGGVVFVSGPVAAQLREIAGLVRASWKGVPTVFVPAAGVISERGEIEGTNAVSGALWEGGRAAPFVVPDDVDFGDGLATALREARPSTSRSPTATFLFCKPEGFDVLALERVAREPDLADAPIFGGGAALGPPAVLDASGEFIAGAAAGLVLSGLASPIVTASPACRLLTPFETIDEASGGFVLRIGGKPALERLAATSAGGGSPEGGRDPALVLVALAEPEGAEDAYVLRPVRGLDPNRRAIMIGPDARPGMRVAFAVRDAVAARADLDTALRKVADRARGSAPRFGLFLSCAGRGQGLYGARDVEARLIRQRLGDVPIAGMHSAFEIAPIRQGGPARMHLFTAVLALFRSPS